MANGPFFRFLDLIKGDLGAQDARVELGGRDPTDPHLVWCALPEGSRLVAIFGEPPPDRELCQSRLRVWAESFEGILTNAAEQLIKPRVSSQTAAERLNAELARLAVQAGALGARVIDVQSAEVWAAYEQSEHDASVELLLERAVEQVRTADRGPRSRLCISEPDFGFVARAFAGIYRVILVYDGPFSELRAQATLNRGLSRLEHCVLALPPADPPGAGARSRRLALVPPSRER